METKKYESPVVFVNEGMAEGVYAASGDMCYTVTYNIHQTPQDGRGDYRISLNAQHAATDGHHASQQTLVITFNIPVQYRSSNGDLAGGDGTNSLTISYSYHNNAGDNIGLGDLVVTADAGLAVQSAVLDCNRDCGQH